MTKGNLNMLIEELAKGFRVEEELIIKRLKEEGLLNEYKEKK